MRTWESKIEREAQNALTLLDAKLARLSSTNQSSKLSADLMNKNRFFELLGDNKYLEQEVKKVLAIAHQYDLQIRAGEYRKNTQVPGQYATFSMSFPVRGSYLQIRRFVEQCLSQTPYMSLDELSFKREATTQSTLDAKVILTIYVRIKHTDQQKERFE